MEIKISTNQVLKALQLLSWIIFIGLCVEAGGTVVNTIITLFVNPLGVGNFWEGKDYLAPLYNLNHGYFMVLTLTMSIVAILKGLLFYLIVKLFTDKQLNMSQPFSMELRRFILNIGYLALAIGLFSQCGFNYSAWLTEQGVETADLQALHIAGADVWIFMSVILFVIAQIVKKGIEIQNENDLTI